jgi:alpha-L-rhamnosidase
MASTPIVPYDQRCEHLVTPLGLGGRPPLLTWKLRSPARGAVVSAHRVQVATRPGDLDRETDLVWDSGRIAPRELPGIEFGGVPLTSSTRYHWRVRVWDGDGVEAGAATSWFETGLLHDEDWQAEWVGHDPLHEQPHDPPVDDDMSARTRRLPRPPYFRRSFSLAARPVRARLHATAHGVAELRLNGARVGDHELAPGWTDYRIRVQYETHDVTDQLVEGETVLGAIVGDGWWSGFYGQNPRRAGQHYGTAPELLVQLVLDFADGSRQVVATDPAWKESTGPLRFADLLLGERYEAPAELGAWDTPGYDDTAWHPVRALRRDRSTLVPTLDPPIRVTRELRPVSVESRGADRWVVDFGQNMVGRVRLTVRGAGTGRTIVLRHAEVLDDGELYLANLRSAEATDSYVAAGRAVEVFEPRFTFHGFRYVEVSGYPGKLTADDLTGRVLQTDTPDVGSFSCSDPLVRRLQSNIEWGQRGNFLSVPTDCPQRDERLGWTADAQIFLPTACYNADVAAFFTKWLQDVRDTQSPEGWITDIAPAIAIDRIGAPAWGDAATIVPWHLYRTYGDLRLLEDSFDSMVAWVGWIERHNPDLLWRRAVGANYGDWLQVGVNTPRDVLATAYFAHSADLVAKAARVLGRQQQADRFTDLGAGIRKAFVAEFVDDDGRIAGDTQTCYLLALAFDLLPDDNRGRAVDHLVADIEAHDRHLSTGFVGVAYLCPVLTRFGHADLAFELLHQRSYPSWGYSIDQGATTIWERWDGWTAEHGFQSANMNSFNHYSLGSVGEWLYRDVAGIGQAEGSVGFGELVLRPHIDPRLDWAEARYDSPRGMIRSRWERAGAELALAVEVPPGVTATVHVPTSAPDSVREAGIPVATCSEVDLIGADGRGVSCRVGSGRYEFTSTYDPGPRARTPSRI